MSCGKPCIIKIFLALLFVNFFIVSIYYFRHSPSVRSDPNFPTEDRGAVVKEFPSPDLPNNKPWPSLPSLLPWIVNPNLNSKSCEAYFGNGFTKRIDVLQTSNSGWFRCFYSETLKSSICEGGVLRMNPERIRMSAGGETLESVVGRTEAEEMPVFSSGAFEIRSIVGVRKNIGDKIMKEEDLNRYVPSGAIEMHTMRSLLDSIRIVGSEQFNCSQWIENPTLLVTRFEYANLFHTMTDWYSAYVASRITGLPSRPHVVFVDGHCKAPLEETWEALFSSLKYAKSFTGPVCFRHAILSPLGYETALFKGLTESINCKGAPVQTILKNPEDARTARLTEFGEMIRYSFGFDPSHKRIRLQSVYNILFVRREDYLAHPRHSGKVQSRLSNEQEVFDSLKSWIPSHLNCKTNLVNGLFAHMTMKDQIQAIQDASVIIGAHGAGLTHIIAALPDTVVLEIISSEYRRPHFSLISEWRGLDYHAIHLSGSYADPNIVTDKFGKIMRSLGC